ncbi:MAG: hypothetical protein AB1442_05330 [Nitrospirota bacterium]
MASCENSVHKLRPGQRVSTTTGDYFYTNTVDWWFDRLTMTIVILSLSKDPRTAHCGAAWWMVWGLGANYPRLPD